MTDNPPALHQYCRDGDSNCLRSWVHSGDCKPGCRICHTTDHITPDCPTWSTYVLTGDRDMPEPEPRPTGHPYPITPAMPLRGPASPALTDWERELVDNAPNDGPVRDVTADESAAMGDDDN